jgi:LiaI-LiaF-like transmembrane region/B-box zinc finger
MNCANHSEATAVAYCRTCGKPLCAQCARDVRGVIYCENCLAARLGATPAPSTTPQTPPFLSGTGPNPALAGVLAGIFPFGVGAVYTGQYAKGLAHLVTFVLLIVGMNQGSPLDTVCGLTFAFFYVYQIIDSVRSAHAVQRGLPAPDPFGLAQAFGAGEKIDTSKVPMAAVWLIGLGVLFLLQTMGVFDLNWDRIWPFFLIVLGGWLFARRWGLFGMSPNRCYCDRCRMRGVMGAAVLITVGLLGLLDSFGHGWNRTWPIVLIVIGLVKILQGHASSAGHVDYSAALSGTPPPASPGSAPQPPQPPSGEVHNV